MCGIRRTRLEARMHNTFSGRERSVNRINRKPPEAQLNTHHCSTCARIREFTRELHVCERKKKEKTRRVSEISVLRDKREKKWLLYSHIKDLPDSLRVSVQKLRDLSLAKFLSCTATLFWIFRLISLWLHYISEESGSAQYKEYKFVHKMGF